MAARCRRLVLRAGDIRARVDVSSPRCRLIVHSGDPAPSPDALDVTRRLAAAGEVLGIAVLDHIIVGDGRSYSFEEAGLL